MALVQPMCPSCKWMMRIPDQERWAKDGSFVAQCDRCDERYTASTDLAWYIEQVIKDELTSRGMR